VGEVVLAMNAEFLGRYDVAPRGHPNDGRVDVLRVDGAMGLRARLQARARARAGTHLPHPRISVSQAASCRIELSRPSVLWLDGVRWRASRTFELTVEPDALPTFA
jgi:diacylglycerol kinase family enzyme